MQPRSENFRRGAYSKAFSRGQKQTSMEKIFSEQGCIFNSFRESKKNTAYSKIFRESKKKQKKRKKKKRNRIHTPSKKIRPKMTIFVPPPVWKFSYPPKKISISYHHPPTRKKFSKAVHHHPNFRTTPSHSGRYKITMTVFCAFICVIQ